MRNKTVIITAIFCLLPLLCKGQFCKLYTTHGEISSSMINNLYQDRRGYIWVTTDDGLNKFDGAKFTNYRSHRNDSTSLLGNHIYKVFQDSRGNLYILSTKGLQIYDYRSDTFKTIKKSSPSYNNKSITELRNGNILIGTSGYGMKTLSTDSKGNYQIKDWNPSLNGYTINEIKEDKNGNIWICTEYHGVIRIDKNGKRYDYSLGTQNGKQFINCCTEDSYGNVYVGTTGRGVFVYQKADDTFQQIFKSEFPIKDLKQKEHLMLIGIDGEGIVSYNILEKKIADTDFYIDNVNIKKSKVHSLLVDNSTNLWVGIYQKGVAFIPLQANMFGYIGNYSSLRNYIGNNCITALCDYDDGKLIVGTDNDGIYQLNNHYNFIRHLTPETNPDIPPTVMCLFKDSNKNVWIGSYLSGLSFMNDKGDRFTKVSLRDKSGNEIKRVYCLAEDAHKRLWIGTMGMGLYYTDLKAPIQKDIHVYSTQDIQAVNQWIDALYYSSNGRLYIGTYDGIKCIDTQNLKVAGKEKALLGLAVYSIVEDHNHRIWVGTSDGISVMDKDLNIIEQFTTQHGLPNNSISSIVVDKNNDIWVSTNQGIAKYNPQKNSFIPFYASDGLYNNEFSRNAFCQYPDGKILFGGTNGIIFFNPDDIKIQKFQGKIRLTGFYLHDKSVNELTKSGNYHVIDTDIFNTKDINLAHYDNSFYLEFATDNFMTPQGYVYSMNNGTWNSLPKGTSRVSFSNLPVGKYEFKIKAVNGSAESEIKTIFIHIHPAWYNSTIAWIIYLAIIGSIAAVFIHQAKEKYRVRQEMLKHKHLEEINEAKLQFFINISHEIRTPMSLIISPLQKLISTDSDTERQKSYSLIERNAQRILNLINQLMDIRKIDKNQMKLSFTEVELIGFINNIKDTFAYQATSKNAQLNLITQLDSLKVWLDPNNFDKVIFNLLSNALKHIQNEGKINIYINSIHNSEEEAPLNNCAEIIIEDNGTGIKESEMTRIFERFYQISDDRSRSKGTGIGLHLSMSLVKMHHGTITVKNNDNQPGCSFIIHIPLGRAHLSAEDIAPETSENTALTSSEDNAFQHIPLHLEENESGDDNGKKLPRKKHSVLIVEDEDDIRNYLLTELSNYFRVLSCSNGKEALEIIMSHMPNLVLSDIMMPEINGITLLKKLKQNIKTNHIPVILLTAKNSEKDYIEGLSLGADAYIAKPFNLEILITTIENLIRNREVLRNNFSGKQEQDGQIEVVQPQSADEKLMKKVMKAINKNLNNPDLNAEMIAAEVGISRVHLYRKLKEITNQSTRDFIRNIRLKQAEILLKSEKNYSISEISQLVGFNNTTYFSNAFKELYGVSPSKYMEYCKENKDKLEEEPQNEQDKTGKQ